MIGFVHVHQALSFHVPWLVVFLYLSINAICVGGMVLYNTNERFKKWYDA